MKPCVALLFASTFSMAGCAQILGLGDAPTGESTGDARDVDLTQKTPIADARDEVDATLDELDPVIGVDASTSDSTPRIEEGGGALDVSLTDATQDGSLEGAASHEPPDTAYPNPETSAEDADLVVSESATDATDTTEGSDAVEVGAWPPPGSFEPLGAPGCIQTLAVWDPGDPWGVGCNYGYGTEVGSIYRLETTDGGRIWNELDPGLWIDIAYPPDSTPWAVDYQTESVWRWNDAQQSFLRVPTLMGALNVGVGSNDQAWAITGDGVNDSVSRWTGSSWDAVPGANPWMIAVSPAGTPWIITLPDYRISYWNGGAWVSLDPQPPGACVQSIAADDHGHVWAVTCSPASTNGKVLLLGPSGWVTIPDAGALQITLDSDGLPWIVTIGGGPYRWIPSAKGNEIEAGEEADANDETDANE
jgi:hypothetical protein